MCEMGNWQAPLTCLGMFARTVCRNATRVVRSLKGLPPFPRGHKLTASRSFHLKANNSVSELRRLRPHWTNYFPI
jgi:hypothetical protein